MRSSLKMIASKRLAQHNELLDKYPNEEKLDARGQYVMPGNICAHTHFYGAYARGMAIPGPAPKDFPEILQKLWWPLDRSLDAESIQYSVLPCLVDAIKHGTTTLIDHHASPNAIDGSLDIIAEAVEEAGLRAVLCYEVTDRDGEAKMKAGNPRKHALSSERRKARFSPGPLACMPALTLSDSSLDLCRQSVPEDVGFHIHTAEHEADEYDSLNKTGIRVIDRLQKHGILGPKTITAHGVHFDAREMQILAETGTWLSHQPRSNMNNGVGVAQIESMLRAGIKVCLGNDGFSNAMWEEWKTAYLLHKVHHRDPRRMGGYDVATNGDLQQCRAGKCLFPRCAHRATHPRRICRSYLCGLSPQYTIDRRESAVAYYFWFSTKHGHDNNRRRQSIDERP